MITLKNVSKWYGHFQVLTDCSTEVKKGEVVVVCGPSGSGKSTLIKTVNGLEPVQQGEITVDGIVVNDKKTDLAKLRSRVGMVFQHFELFPHLSIIENLTLAQVKVLKRDKAPAREKALKLLERVGLSAHANKFPAQLSGWYAPDHDYGPRSSVFVPLFAVEQAATTTGTWMLARMSGACLVPFVPRRKPDGKGYQLIMLPPECSPPLDDAETTAAWMNKVVEKCIMMAPEQYMWLHRRFKTRPEGVPSRY